MSLSICGAHASNSRLQLHISGQDLGSTRSPEVSSARNRRLVAGRGAAVVTFGARVVLRILETVSRDEASRAGFHEVNQTTALLLSASSARYMKCALD